MPSYVPPARNVAYVTYVALVDQSNTKLFKAASTQAAGDWKVSKDGGALNNLATLPTVTPAGGVMVQISLSATEMDADNVTVVGIDAAGSEWASLVINIQTSARRIDDLTYPAVTGRSTAIDASGQVSVGTIAANAVNASALATDAVTELQTGLATAASIAALNNVSVAQILAGVVEGTITLQGALRLALATLVGRSNGGGTTTINFRDQANLKNRVQATVDATGNRSAVNTDTSD